MASKMTSVEKDTISRNRIVSETGTNFFVEAGAGSGKTTMLVSRMVAMVEAGINISKICAITFTKAAAGEFYDRFQKLLIERSNPDYMWEDKGFAGQLPAPTDETRALCGAALQNIDLCFMGTIDSFCNMVLSEHPSEAGIPSDAKIMTDVDMQMLYKQIYVKICEGKYDAELTDLSRAFRGMHRNAEEVFASGMSLVMNNRNAHFNYSDYVPIDIDRAFAAERNEINAALDCLIKHPEIAYTKNKNSENAWAALPDAAKTLRRRWSSNFSSVLYSLNKIKAIRLLPEAANTYGASLSGVFESDGKTAAWLDFTLDCSVYKKLQKLQYDASMSFLIKCITVIEQEMKDKGCLSFFDYLYYLRNMLHDDAQKGGKLIHYIYNRHSYFLIDEFQDTNPMQAEIFFYLASEHPVSNWMECVPRPGSLFIVGDPKQSIYRFRSADVTSFLNVKELFSEKVGDVLYLSRNFRSTKELCAYFNRVFSQMLPEESENQSKFEEIPLPDKECEDFQGIFQYKAYTGQAEKLYPDTTDPQQIFRIIEKLVNNNKYLIRTGNDKELRKIKYSDIMVITKAKANLGPIMTVLDQHGIPTRVEGKVSFSKSEALVEINQIYSAVADSENIIGLYAALTGKLIGLKPEEILKYKASGGNLTLKSLAELTRTDDRALLVEEKMKALQKLYYKAMKLSPAALFTEIMDSFEVYRIAQAENLEVLYYTLELMRNAEKAGLIVSAKDGADYIASLIAGNSDEERCLSLNDNKDAVHMANLHKVKGLEAPVVILAAASARGGSTATKRFEHGEAGSEGYVFKLNKNKESFAYFETSDYEDKAAEEKAALQAEGLRLVYVAATRARNALIVCDSYGTRGTSEVRDTKWEPIIEDSTPDFFAATGESLPSVHAVAECVNSADLYEKAKDECVLNDRAAETHTYETMNPSHARVSSKLTEDMPEAIVAEDESIGAASEVEDKTISDVHRLPALLGTMAHRLMEVLVSTKNAVDADQTIAEIINEYLTPENKPYEKKLEEALKKVAVQMRAGGYRQSNGVCADILSELLSADECYCEVPFCYKEETTDGPLIWNGVMDVIYKKDGHWHIIDYKTNADGKDLDTKYMAQLEAYTKAFKTITGEDVADAKTYHIDI